MAAIDSLLADLASDAGDPAARASEAAPAGASAAAASAPGKKDKTKASAKAKVVAMKRPAVFIIKHITIVIYVMVLVAHDTNHRSFSVLHDHNDFLCTTLRQHQLSS